MFRPPNVFTKQNNPFIYNNSMLNQNRVTRNEALKTGIFEVTAKFCRRTGIHGLVYLGDRKRCLIERVFWTIAILISLSLCGYGAYKLWENHGTEKIVIRISKTPDPIDSIPFPAVTICPVTKAAAKRFNYTDVYRSVMKLDGKNSRNVTNKEFETLTILNQLCEFEKLEKFKNIPKAFCGSYVSESVYRILLETAPAMKETFVFCKLIDVWVDCDEILFPVVTDSGFCYTFNALKLTEYLTDKVSFNVSDVPTQKRSSTWNIDKGYNKDTKLEDSYPFRAVDAGFQHSLLVILKTNDYDVDYVCGGDTQGYKIGFHSPIDAPISTKNFFSLSLNRAATYSVEPKFTKTVSKVRNFKPHNRRCYLTKERELQFYRQYSRTNCVSECASNYTLAQCGCVHFAMQHGRDSKICGQAKLPCILEVGRNFYNSDELKKCDCLPSCSEITYNAYVSTTDFDFARSLSHTTYNKVFDLNSAQFSRLIVSFKDEMFVPYVRVENYTWVDILSNIGGFCGLFVGASLVSIVELLYYYTFRVYFTYRNNRSPATPIFPYLP